MKTTLLTLALTAAGVAAVAVAQAQPAPEPPPPTPAPTATTDPNAPPPPSTDAPAPAPSPTTTSTAAPDAPPPGTPAPDAQGDPNAPPPPAAPPPPPVAPPVAQQPPPPPVFVPPPVTPVGQPSTPTTTPPPAPAAKPAPSFLSRFAGSSVGWNHSVNAKFFGICAVEGADPDKSCQGGESDSYVQTVTLQPAFFLYRGERHLVRLVSTFSIITEMTNSDTTTYERQPDLFDVPIRITDTIPIASWGAGEGGAAAGALARDPTLAGAAEYRSWGLLNAGVNFPTSRASQGSGLQIMSSVGAGVRQQIKLMGSSADFLNNITFTLSETWQHMFWRATTRVNDDLERPRQNAGGGTILSDQLGPGANVENRLVHSISFFMPIVGDLQVNGLFQVWNDFPYQFKGSDCDFMVMGECRALGESETKMRSITQFDVSLYYQISPELGADIGYNNFAGQLNEAGRWRNPFAGPSSLFYADIILFPDQLIKRIITPSKPATAVGKR